MSDLPDGWNWIKLAEIVHSLANGRSVPDGPDTGYPVLRLTAIKSGVIDTTASKNGDWTAENAYRFRIRRGDYLVARGNGSKRLVGRGGMVREDADIAFPDTMIRIRFDETKVCPAYGALIWDAPLVRTQIESAARTTAGIYKVSQRDLRELRIPLPPIEEQKRVAAAIEEQFSRLDAGVAALERVRQNLKRMRAAVLQAGMTGGLVPHSDEDVASILERISMERRAVWRAATNKPYREPLKPGTFALPVPKHWCIASLEQITDPVRVICYGILMPKEDIKNGIPYVRVKDMRGWSIDVAGLKKTSPEIAAKYARASLHAGDILLAIRGSYGRVAIIPPELNGGNITQDSARIASHPDIDHRYLLYYLGGSVANRYYAEVARGVAVKGVNIGDLKSMPIPIPPRQEQEAIADEIERQFALLDNAEAVLQAATSRGKSLRSSILAVAFSGGLVSQDPTDEPASISPNKE
jgi:type I restriction enzyme S subunit